MYTYIHICVRMQTQTCIEHICLEAGQGAVAQIKKKASVISLQTQPVRHSTC